MLGSNSKKTYRIQFDHNTEFADWLEVESQDNDFSVMLPRHWSIEKDEDDDCPLLAYIGRECGSRYIIQRVDYSSLVMAAKLDNALTSKLRRQLLTARMGLSIQRQRGHLVSKRYSTFVGYDAIEFRAESKDTEMDGLILWRDGKTYALFSIFAADSMSQFPYFKANFKLER